MDGASASVGAAGGVVRTRSVGVDLTSEQQTKTKTALEFFAGELTAASPDH